MKVLRTPELSLVCLLLIDGLICERHDAQVSFRWEESALAIALEERVPRNYVRLQHPLVQQKSTQRLAHNGIDRVERDLLRANVLNLRLNDSHDVLKSIMLDQSPRQLGRLASFTSIDFFCSGLRRKQAQNTTSTADIHDNFALEVSGILQDSVSIARRSHAVLEHVLLIGQFAIVTKVLPHRGHIICMDAADSSISTSCRCRS